MQEKQKVYLVGAGPGDYALMTLKGKQLIDNADVIVYDSLIGKDILSSIPQDKEFINVGKRASNHTMPQKEINMLLVKKAKENKMVVRLKGGDPFVFGRGGEEIEILKEHGIDYEVVPGVTSALASSAYIGVPITHRNYASSIYIVTGQAKQGERPQIDFDALVRLNASLVFMMSVKNLAFIANSLMKAGMDENMPVAVIEKATTSKQRKVVSNLKNIVEDAKEQNISTPAVIVVGKVCKLSKDLSFREQLPLAFCRIVVTRPKPHTSRLAKFLRELGAEVIEMPTIQTKRIENNRLLDKALENLKNYQWIVLTSPTAVKFFFESLREKNIDIRTLLGIHFAAIGSATKNEIEKRGIHVDLVPNKYTAEELGTALSNNVKAQEKILLPRAKVASKLLTDTLDKNDIYYDDVPLYETTHKTHPLISMKELLKEGIDYVTFTSQSTVEGFVESEKDVDFSQIHAICIGEQTAKAAEKYHMQVIISEEITILSMIDTIVKLEQKKRGLL